MSETRYALFATDSLFDKRNPLKYMIEDELIYSCCSDAERRQEELLDQGVIACIYELKVQVVDRVG